MKWSFVWMHLQERSVLQKNLTVVPSPLADQMPTRYLFIHNSLASNKEAQRLVSYKILVECKGDKSTSNNLTNTYN
jgi:hypothetical protein